MIGLEITAGGKRIAWLRDEVDMFTFHLTVPTCVDRIDTSAFNSRQVTASRRI
jgi:hypothetical protein